MDFRAVQERLRQVMEEVQEESGNTSDNLHQTILSDIEINLMSLKRQIRGYELAKKSPRS